MSIKNILHFMVSYSFSKFFFDESHSAEKRKEFHLVFLIAQFNAENQYNQQGNFVDIKKILSTEKILKAKKQ